MVLNMKRILILTLLAGPVMASCGNKMGPEAYANEITNTFRKQQSKKHQLSIYGKGGSMPDDVRSLYVYLESDRKLDLPEARKLIVQVVLDFLQAINTDARLRQYARNWPFNETNVRVGIRFSQRNKYMDPPYIAYVFILDGTIYYEQNNPQTDRFVDFHKEPYSEAVRIVNGTAAE